MCAFFVLAYLCDPGDYGHPDAMDKALDIVIEVYCDQPPLQTPPSRPALKAIPRFPHHWEEWSESDSEE